jgi:hypothetical protein
MATLFSSCDKKEKEAEQTPYWGMAFLPGNFSIDGQNVSIYADINSVNHTVNYVQKEELPDSSFRSYSIKLYLPIDTESYNIVSDSVFATIHVNNSATDIPVLIAERHTEVIDTVQYTIFKVTAMDSAALGSPDGFQNISFSFYFHYTDLAKNTTATNRHIIADIYKKE